MPISTCFTSLMESIAQGLDHLERPDSTTPPRTDATQSNAQSSGPPVRPDKYVRQRGCLQFLQFNRRKYETMDRTSRNHDAEARKAFGAESVDKALPGLVETGGIDMGEVLRLALTPTLPGEPQRLVEHAWKVVYQFDENRLHGLNSFELSRDFARLHDIALDNSHQCWADAVLLKDILTRPVDGDVPLLEEYLAQKVQAGLHLNMEITPHPDARTFNSILPGLVLSSLDYNSIGRTLLFKGATHLIGIPSKPDATGGPLTPSEKRCKDGLQTAMFEFPRTPSPGAEQLALHHFNAEIGPLDGLGVYQ